MLVSLRRYSLFFGFILVLFNNYQCLANNLPNQPAKGIADGAGVWINMWNYPADSDSYCLKLYSNGIRNIFIQTSRSNTPAIANPAGLSRLLNSAHRYQMRVIAWSFNELINPLADAKKLITAANFRSDQGEKIDALAANMEKDLTPAKIKVLCETVKQSLGSTYPLIAVVYSPLNHAPVVATTPWPLLAEQFSVIAVMSYWNSKYTKNDAYQYTLATIKRIRQLTGKPDVDIHVIGDGMGTISSSISQFMVACKHGAATSASLYPNQQITAEQLSTLSRYPEFFPINGRLRLAAFRELIKSGKLSCPQGEDPSSNISRGQFYQLLARQFYPGAFANAQSSDLIYVDLANANEDELRSLAILDKAHVLAGLPAPEAGVSQFLTTSIPAKEAFDTIAKVIETREQSKNHHLGGQIKTFASHQTKRADRLFVQPAYAEPKSTQADAISSNSSLSYFDAAQIVLLAAGSVH